MWRKEREEAVWPIAEVELAVLTLEKGMSGRIHVYSAEGSSHCDFLCQSGDAPPASHSFGPFSQRSRLKQKEASCWSRRMAQNHPFTVLI